jgi:hypothetical protein
MAKQTILIGTTANDGTGTPLRDAFDMINDNFTELYADDAADVNSVNGQSGAVVLDTDDISEGTTNKYNATHTGDVTGSTALTIAADAVTTAKILDANVTAAKIADDSISYAKLGGEFTTKLALSGATPTADFNLYQVFTQTIVANTTVTISNPKLNDVKTFVIAGDSASTFGFSVVGGETFYLVSGAFDNTSAYNLIQVECVDDTAGAEVFYLSVSQGTSATTL